ncbi:hypothetical protein [Chitinophaga defluvii]|uniref:Immunity protein 50 of polymorphic toxin system n=1 Tax=Chitinophaga defluvii TaxID=3163343 RepID=A0ABV2TB69_9BACT
MNKHSKVDAAKISLLDIITLKGSIDLADETMAIVKPAGYSFEFKTDSHIQPDDKLIRFYLHSSIKCFNETEQLNGVTADYTLEFIFEVSNLLEFIMLDDVKQTIKVDNQLGVTIASIAYSTARGVIFDKTQGTPLDGVILPVINPLNLIK